MNEELIDQQNFQDKVDPLINAKLDYLKKNFPDLFGPVITAGIRKQIDESQEEFVNALYPIMGKLVKKYIRQEIKKLVQNLQQQANSVFSWKNIKRRAKSIILGRPYSSFRLEDVNTTEVSNIFLISQDNGLLICSLNPNESEHDEDLVAGTLTAIRQFAESALGAKNDRLSEIELYEKQILIINMRLVYFAIIYTGIMSINYKEKVEQFILEFAASWLHDLPEQFDGNYSQKIAKQLSIDWNEFRN